MHNSMVHKARTARVAKLTSGPMPGHRRGSFDSCSLTQKGWAGMGTVGIPAGLSLHCPAPRSTNEDSRRSTDHPLNGNQRDQTKLAT